MKVEYEPGLEIEWSERELKKIAEIKARRIYHKNLCGFKEVPWDNEKIRHYKIIKAVSLLQECGLPIYKIAELFNLNKQQVINYIRQNRDWKW